MVSNGRVFESGTVIRAGEQLPTQQVPPMHASITAQHTAHRKLTTHNPQLTTHNSKLTRAPQILHYCHPVIKKVRGWRCAAGRHSYSASPWSDRDAFSLPSTRTCLQTPLPVRCTLHTPGVSYREGSRDRSVAGTRRSSRAPSGGRRRRTPSQVSLSPCQPSQSVQAEEYHVSTPVHSSCIHLYSFRG
jgi:hypothetical protein